MKVEKSLAVRGHAPRTAQLGEIAAHASLVGLYDKVIRIQVALTEQCAVVNDCPNSCRLATHVPGFGVGIEHEAMVGRDDNVGEARLLQLVNRNTNGLQRPVDQVQCGQRFRRIVFQMCIDIEGAQHQEFDRVGGLVLGSYERVELSLCEPVAKARPNRLHAVGDCRDLRAVEGDAEAVSIFDDPQPGTRPGKSSHADRRDGGKLKRTPPECLPVRFLRVAGAG